MRSAIFTLVGAILLATASFLYGMVFLDEATQEPAFFLVIGGTVSGGFLGLLVAELTRPSGGRRTRLFFLGAAGGLLAGLVYGVLTLEEGCEPGSPDPGPCGWVFLSSLFRRFWTPVALWTVFGGIVGAFLGLAAGFGLPRREPAVETSGRR